MHSDLGKLEAVSVMKVFMMIAVVLGHSCIVYSAGNWGGVLPQKNVPLSLFVQFLSTVHTWGFGFASGFLFSFNRYTLGKYRSPVSDFKRRAARLVVPYCIFALLWAAPADLLLKGSSLGQTVRNYTLVLNCAQLWFLIMLFLVYVLFYYVSDWLVKLPLAGGVTFLLVLRLIVAFSENYIPIGVFSISNALRYALVYYLGIQWERTRLTTPCGAMTTALFILDIAVFAGFVLWFQNSYCIIKEVIICILNILGVICLAGTSSIVSKSVVHNRLFKMVAPACMGIYLFHQQIIYAILHSISPNSLPPFLYALICFVIALSLAYLAATGIKHFKFGKIALGDK